MKNILPCLFILVIPIFINAQNPDVQFNFIAIYEQEDALKDYSCYCQKIEFCNENESIKIIKRDKKEITKRRFEKWEQWINKNKSVYKKIDKNNQDIIYDFATKKFLSPPNFPVRFHARKNAYVRVINTNPLKHTVIITGKTKPLFIERKSDFESLITPTSDQQKEAESGTLSKNESENLGNLNLEDSTTGIINNKINNLKKLESALKAFRNHIQNKDYINICALEEAVKAVKKDISASLELESGLNSGVASFGKKILKEMSTHPDKFSSQDGAIIQQSINDIISILSQFDQIDYSVQAITIPLNNTDLLEVDIEVKEGNNSVDHLGNPLQIYTKSGFKIDFSSGLFLTGLRDFEYILKDSIVTDNSTTPPTSRNGKKVLRTREGNLLANVGLGVMAHARIRLSDYVDPAISTGFILQTGDEAVMRYLFGGSLILGLDQRMIFNGGIALGKVRRLSAGIFEGDFLEIQGVNEIPTDSVWESSWYVGVTYNF